jgi:glycosyltransferase involved in cell wall biosynthesis
VRVLVISDIYPPEVIGGYEQSCNQAVDALRRRGHDVRVLTTVPQLPVPPEDHVLRLLRRPDVFSTERLSSRSQFWELESNLLDSGNIYALTTTLDQFRPDVCYLWNLVGIGGAGIVGALEYLGEPWVWHLADAVPSQLCIFNGAVLPIAVEMSRRLTGRFLAVSQGLVNEIEHVVDLGDRTRIVPLWVTDSEKPLRRTYSDGTFVSMAFAGQLVEHKGVLIALEALSQLRTLGYSQFSLDLYGRGADHMIAQRVRQLGLDPFVNFRGWTPQAELRRQLRNHDLFLFPTWAREPFGIAPLEAAAEGCVPLISASSGIAEWLVDDVHCLKAARDSSAFAAVIKRVLDGEIDLAAIGRRASYLVRAQFTLEHVLPVIEEELSIMATQHREPMGSRADLYQLAIIAEALIRRSLTQAA